jgi:hypothetical protein
VKGAVSPRLFISHSGKDSVEALAFRRWLVANGWAENDVFIDLHGIGGAAESERFLELLASVFNDLPEDVDPYVLVTIRANRVEPLLQRWPALGLAATETQMLPPLSPTAYRDVITKPAEVYTERARRLVVEPALADKLVPPSGSCDSALREGTKVV